jgi:hypothetical protein
MDRSFVLPRTETEEYSQLRHAKKKAAIKSVTWARTNGSSDRRE